MQMALLAGSLHHDMPTESKWKRVESGGLSLQMP